MISGPADDLDATATLAAVEAGVDLRRRTAVAELCLVLRWADLHSIDPQTQPGAVPVGKGGDRLITLGGEGTPTASEFCWAELAIAREAGLVATKNLAADALDLRHRLPLFWAAVRDLHVEVWVARKVAVMTRCLTRDQAGLVDAAVAAAVEESPSRILAIAEAKTIEADLEGHRARLAADAAKTGVWLSRPRAGDAVDEVTGEPATRRVSLKLPTGAAVEFDAMVEDIAYALAAHSDPDTTCSADDVPTRDTLRVKAVELLANPHAAAAFLDQAADPDPASPEAEETPSALPAPKKRRPATIYLHLTADVVTGMVPGVARVEGMGPMLLEQIADLLGHRHVTIQPVIDLNTGHSVNAYEHPTRIREATLLRTLGDVFPHSTSQTRRVDHDHVVPYDADGPPGQTGDHNTAPLIRSHHRAKTHDHTGGGYQLHQLGLGTYRWTTPHGLGRLVTLAGTRRFQSLRDPTGTTIGEIYPHQRTVDD